MTKLVTVLLGLVLTNATFAAIPANVELPIVAVGLQKFTPSEDRPVVFRIDASQAKTSVSDTLHRLNGCTLEGIAHLEAKPQRIMITNTKIKCPTEAGTTKKPHEKPYEGRIKGQILGLDHRTGLRITCKYQPLCSLATLKDGETGYFLTSK